MDPPAKPRNKGVQPKLGGKARLRSLDQLDRRYGAAQVAFAFRDELTADLGGADRLTAGERALVDHAAVLNAMLSDAGARFLAGDKVDVTEFLAIGNAFRRAVETLGLQRRPVDVTPGLGAYLAAKREAAA